MHGRVFQIAALTAVLLSPAVVSAQQIPPIAPVPGSVCPDSNPLAVRACGLEHAKTFKPKRTPDGRPDLSGFWGGPQVPHENMEAHPRTPDDTGGPSAVADPPD